MSNQLTWTILLMGGLLFILLLSEYLHKSHSIATEYTRKLAHILGSLSSLIFIVIFDSYWHVIAIGLFFFLLLFIGKRKNSFRSIDSVQRHTAGSYLLPIAICGLFVIAKTESNNLLFVLPILILGISDPLAGLAGTRFATRTKKIRLRGRELQKTYLGSSVFFFTTLLITLITLQAYSYKFAQAITISLLMSTVGTIVELLSTKGYDNLFVPMVLQFLLWSILV